MRALAVQGWDSLLGQPFGWPDRGDSGIDCLGVVVAVYRMMGLEFPGLDFVRPVSCEGEAHAAVSDHLESFASRWKLLGRDASDADRAGDVVVSDHRGRGIGSHISVLVDVRGDLFLSSLFRLGVVAVRGHEIEGVIGVYRLWETER